jgi:hypothetical protein
MSCLLKTTYELSTFNSLHVLIFFKVVFLKVVHPLKIYQHTKFYDTTLTGANIAYTSEV